MQIKNCFNLLILLAIFTLMVNRAKSDGLVINGYVDTYYSTDNDPNATKNRILYNVLNSEKDKFDINLAMVSFSYNDKDYRSKITLQHGAIQKNAWEVNNNLIQEAYVGVKLSKDLWLDAGCFLTHMGAEVITPKDNWLSTLALSTLLNEPFYQEGLKLTYDVNDKLQLHLHLLNGYNIFNDNNVQKSIGYYILYKFNDDFTLSLAGIYGTEPFLGLINPENKSTYKDTPKLLNNFVLNYNFSKSLLMEASLDISSQKINLIDSMGKGLNGTSSALSGYAALRYLFSDKYSISGRYEFHNSKSDESTSYQLNSHGITIGLEYKPNSNSYMRVETRQLNFDNKANNIYPFESRLEGIFSFGVFF